MEDASATIFLKVHTICILIIYTEKIETEIITMADILDNTSPHNS